jgi:hypothetical protein
MSAFTKTIGGLDPWSMPSDGVNGTYIHLDSKTKRWERKQYNRASRRQSKRLIEQELESIDHS